jgi:hypothetical protein
MSGVGACPGSLVSTVSSPALNSSSFVLAPYWWMVLYVAGELGTLLLTVSSSLAPPPLAGDWVIIMLFWSACPVLIMELFPVFISMPPP